MDFLDELRSRQLLHQTSAEKELREALAAGPVTGYIGFDPTASSLHVGSLLQVMLLVRLARAGHRPIALVGGATGLVGDPSGKATERAMMSTDALHENLAGIRAQLGRYLDFNDSPTGAVLVDNASWFASMGVLEFLRDVGKHFSVNAMVQRDSVKTRLEAREQGISYTEFSYMLLQAYDFLALHDRFGCTLQMGGSDQWGNIVSGADLVRRLRDRHAFALTSPLLLKADGTKFGKSETGNVWLDPKRTSPFAFYQFFLKTEDAAVESVLLRLSLEPTESIADAMAQHATDPGRRVPQKLLAESMTRFVHGDEGLARAQHVTRVLFGGEGDLRAVDASDLADVFRGDDVSTVLPHEVLGTPEGALLAWLVASGLFKSKSEARTIVTNGGVSINNVRETDPKRVLTRDDLVHDRYIVLRKGKAHHRALRLE